MEAKSISHKPEPIKPVTKQNRVYKTKKAAGKKIKLRIDDHTEIEIDENTTEAEKQRLRDKWELILYKNRRVVPIKTTVRELERKKRKIRLSGNDRKQA